MASENWPRAAATAVDISDFASVDRGTEPDTGLNAVPFSAGLNGRLVHSLVDCTNSYSIARYFEASVIG